MKPKIYIALMLLMLSLTGSAQGVKHFEFLGIPIDGSQQNFESMLSAKGFHKTIWKGVPYFEGTFLNEAIRLQTEIGPRTGKTAIVGIITQKESSGQSIFNEIERWKNKLARTYNANFYETQGIYKAEIPSPRGILGISYLCSDTQKELYVVNIWFIDSENIGK